MASGLRPQRSTTEVFVHEGIGSGTVLEMSAVAWNQRREDNRAEREADGSPVRALRPALLGARRAAPLRAGGGGE